MPDDQLTNLYERALIASSKPSIDPAKQDEIEAMWEEVHGGVDVTDPNAFGPFLAEFIRKRWEVTPAEKRSERLCDSGNHLCRTLRGDVPTALQPDRGRFSSERITVASTREYVAENGKCVVVADALEAWRERRSETKQRLRSIIRLSRQSGGADVDESNLPGRSGAEP